MSTNLQLYYLFKDTTVLSNNVQLLCEATLTTYCSYSSGAATSWCSANTATFNAVPFSKQKQLIRYVVTTPISNTLGPSVISAQNNSILNATLWTNGFFSKETGLAAVIDVENYNFDRTFYLVFMPLYIVFWMIFCLFVYRFTRSSSGKRLRKDVRRVEYFLATIQVLLWLSTSIIIGIYGFTMVSDNNYTESKSNFAMLEHIAVINIVAAKIFVMIFW